MNSIIEAVVTVEPANQNTQSNVLELSELDLALVGGGSGDIVYA